MANAVFAYKNLADAGVVSVSSSLPLTPPERLTARVPQIAKKCRNGGENTWGIVVDVRAMMPIDLFAMIGVNLSSAGAARFRLSSIDSAGLAGDVYDSGNLNGLIDPKYGYLIHRLSTPATARFARMDLSEPSLPYIEAGRVIVSLSQQAGINFAPGWGRSRIDQSKQAASENGVIYIDRRLKYRQWELSFDYLSESEANDFVEEMSYLNGASDDVLFIADPDSTNLGRDAIYGLVTESALTQPYPMPDIQSRKYTIKERL